MLLASIILASAQALITDPTWIFFMVLGIILLAPILLRRLRIPHIIGLILAGMLVGEHGFNLLSRDSSFELFGQVGIYYIMFLAALELDMGSVAQYGRSGLKFGILTFLIPFVLGWCSCRYILHYETLTSILMACIFASHTLVSYPTVSRYGLSKNSAVVISVVATAFTTFAALLIVAFVERTQTTGSSLLTWMLFPVKCLLYVTFVLLVFPRLGRWFLRRYDDEVMQYIFIMALVFLSAALAKLSGLEGLLGAFLAGLVINRLIPRTSPLMSHLEFVGNALFIPYFLIGVGMIINLHDLSDGLDQLWPMLILVATGIITKWIASADMA